MSMDKYVRRQAVMAGLTRNLEDLYKERESVITTLKMLDKMIEKHENFLELLEDDEDN
jgi:flagellar biosynthesis/type III secretory pathway chaperone